MVFVLGIETSCDETAAAIVSGDREIKANIVLSQIKEHQPYGGVVPEIAARSHLSHLEGIVQKCLKQAGMTLGDISAVAATGGPGLIGGLIVGVMTAKAMSAARGLPFIAVNHLEAHALTARLTNDVQFPYLLLLVSGGHCQLLIVKGVGQYKKLGTTKDDAVGEAFDKVAKMLNLGYPGGPLVEKAARDAKHPERFVLPIPMKGQAGCDFSFSGLKTAVCQKIMHDLGDKPAVQDVADLSAAFQQAATESLIDRCRNAIQSSVVSHQSSVNKLVIAGGVAANTYIREQLKLLAEENGFELIAPPISLCGDNAAMIAWAGLERFRLGQQDGMDFAPRPRWPLEEMR